MNKIFSTISKIKQKISGIGLQWAPLSLAGMMSFAVVVAQPVNAVSIPGLGLIECPALATFSAAGKVALQAGQDTMNATFNLTITALQTAWQLEDSAKAALRQVSESAFTALLNAFEQLRGLNTIQQAAIVTYRDLLLKTVHVLEANIDAAEAAYREDILALIKQFQKSLGDLVQTLVDTINNATATALKNCNNPDAVATLLAVIASANATLLAQSLVLEAQTIAKAVTVELTRDTILVNVLADLIKVGTDATLKLTQVILTGKAAN